MFFVGLGKGPLCTLYWWTNSNGKEVREGNIFTHSDCKPMVQHEVGFKNQNRNLDLPRHNSWSCYRKQNIFFGILVPVNPETEF